MTWHEIIWACLLGVVLVLMVVQLIALERSWRRYEKELALLEETYRKYRL